MDAKIEKLPTTIGPDGGPRLAQANGERIDIQPVVDWLKPIIEECQEEMDVTCRLPQRLVDAMFDAGIFATMLPREVGGLELHTIDYMDLSYELGRIDGTVAWIVNVQSGVLPLLAPDVMNELREQAGGRWIPSGSHSAIGNARLVEGGYRFSGQWAFASGSPWATHLTAYAQVVDDDGEPVLEDGEPIFLDGVIPTAEVDHVGGWNPLGLRGSGSGRFALDDVFVPERFTLPMAVPDDAYSDRPQFHALVASQETGCVLGMAQGMIDAFAELADPDDLNSRITIARTDALLRAAKDWCWRISEQMYDLAFADEAVRYKPDVESWQACTHAGRVAKQIANEIFDAGGTNSVVVGRGIERRFRDVQTITQHEGFWEKTFKYVGQYRLTEHRPGGPRMDDHPLLGPPPGSEPAQAPTVV
ncbi:MAG TPA: acyl-CoA dehydrogenase family protein [Baekduia sp.]|nr:acyl-CoA dehydrogenase family protein [Baekduia sp.]